MKQKGYFNIGFPRILSSFTGIWYIGIHCIWIYNTKYLIVRKYIDGLEPKSPVNFITIFKFQNWLVGQLPGPILAGLPASY